MPLSPEARVVVAEAQMVRRIQALKEAEQEEKRLFTEKSETEPFAKDASKLYSDGLDRFNLQTTVYEESLAFEVAMSETLFDTKREYNQAVVQFSELAESSLKDRIEELEKITKDARDKVTKEKILFDQIDDEMDGLYSLFNGLRIEFVSIMQAHEVSKAKLLKLRESVRKGRLALVVANRKLEESCR